MLPFCPNQSSAGEKASPVEEPLLCFNFPDGQSIMEGRSALQNGYIILVHTINQNTSVIIQALHNLNRTQIPSHFLSSFFLLSFILLRYVGIFLVLSSVHLLLVFSWCSVRTVPSVKVFLMHLWRQMKSMTSYSSTVLVNLLSWSFFNL